MLLSEEDYKLLNNLSEREGKSMGQLIRNAIKKIYKKDGKKHSNISREVKKGWRLLRNPKKKIDYKALVEYGRK